MIQLTTVELFRILNQNHLIIYTYYMIYITKWVQQLHQFQVFTDIIQNLKNVFLVPLFQSKVWMLLVFLSLFVKHDWIGNFYSISMFMRFIWKKIIDAHFNCLCSKQFLWNKKSRRQITETTAVTVMMVICQCRVVRMEFKLT